MSVEKNNQDYFVTKNTRGTINISHQYFFSFLNSLLTSCKCCKLVNFELKSDEQSHQFIFDIVLTGVLSNELLKEIHSINKDISIFLKNISNSSNYTFLVSFVQ